MTFISIKHLSFPPSSLIPNMKCIAWNFDGSNFFSTYKKKEDSKLRFENGDTIPDIESYFSKTIRTV
jgi:hypothetical protein